MQQQQTASSEKKRAGVATLFDEYELKSLLRRYVQLLIGLEVLIFLVCWVYQLGLGQVALTGEPANIAFPWKAYFLVAFAMPVAVTFLAGIVVTAFNSFVYGQRGTSVIQSDVLPTGSQKLARIVNFCCQLPFLLMLFLLGIFLGVVYNFGAIMYYLARFGEATSRFVLIGLGCILLAGTVFGVMRMVLNYKLRQKNMEYEYRREIMAHLGIAILDDATMINSQGVRLKSDQVQALPPCTGLLAEGSTLDNMAVKQRS